MCDTPAADSASVSVFHIFTPNHNHDDDDDFENDDDEREREKNELLFLFFLFMLHYPYLDVSYFAFEYTIRLNVTLMVYYGDCRALVG